MRVLFVVCLIASEILSRALDTNKKSHIEEEFPRSQSAKMLWQRARSRVGTRFPVA